MHLANLHSLPNKMGELLLLNGTNMDFESSAALCFTETWLSEAVPDAGLYLPGFSLHRSDHVKQLSGKSKGGGIRFYINEGWYTPVTVLSEYCSPNLEYFIINPREFSSIMVRVYTPQPPEAGMSETL